MSARVRAIGLCRVAALLVVGGCAGGGAIRVSDVTPEAIPALVDFPAARGTYESFLTVARSRELRDTARGRLVLVGRRELEYHARVALAQESTLVNTAPEENTVAAIPFAYSGTNEEIRPLSRGFAQLIVTDLAKSRQLRVLERDRMQAMLDELRLSDSSQADPQTALRSGRLLRAARVVQGSLADQGQNLRVDAAVVDVSSAADDLSIAAQQTTTSIRYGFQLTDALQVSPALRFDTGNVVLDGTATSFTGWGLTLGFRATL